MTQEQKYLLLKDLCARLPYGVAVKFKVNEVSAIEEKFIYNIDGEYSYITNGKSYLTLDIIKALFNNHLDEIKPYLFPLSSITEEQWKEITDIQIKESLMSIDSNNDYMSNPLFSIGDLKTLDWCYVNHIDYRGFIPMGLAIDATDKNIY